MNYEELIKQIRNEAVHPSVTSQMRVVAMSAADAIESLTSDALKKQEPVASVDLAMHSGCINWTVDPAELGDCTNLYAEPVAQPSDTLLKEMRYIAGISTGQVKRVADAALASLAQPAEPSSDDKTWCEYVAGMVGCYLGEPVDSAKCKAIASIIERRLWALQRPAKPVELSDETIIEISESLWGSELDYKHTIELAFARAVLAAKGKS